MAEQSEASPHDFFFKKLESRKEREKEKFSLEKKKKQKKNESELFPGRKKIENTKRDS